MTIVGGVLLLFVPAPPPRFQTGPASLLLAAGFLVGFGTRLGNGCTSGHGVCGLGRFSKRSLAAVGDVRGGRHGDVVFVMRHVLGFGP